MTIVTLLNQIRRDEIVLPGIQRNFVWLRFRITKLLDSIMRGYPIGLVLLWETYEDLPYRNFVKDYKGKNVFTFRNNPRRRRLKLVLDGQQRLQSLFIAVYGTRLDDHLYFDVLSGRPNDDLDEEKYSFDFMTAETAKDHNSYAKELLLKPADEWTWSSTPQYHVKLSELFEMDAREKKEYSRTLTKELALSEEHSLRIELNLTRIDEALCKDENLLHVCTIDENLSNESRYRKSETDVLEIFVRVNQEVTTLTRSDLMFSILKLNWKDSAQALPKFVETINTGNSLNLDTDFVIRCLLAVSNLGTKFDVKLLRKQTNVHKLKANFGRCCDAIKASIDFVVDQCWVRSGRLIGGSNVLVPFVYYLYHTKKHQIPDQQMSQARKSFFMFAFTRPFSRYGDSRLGAFIRSSLAPLCEEGKETFPLADVIRWVDYWVKIRTFEEALLQENHGLTLHLIQGLSGAKVQYKDNSPEIDHIFPRSQLRNLGYDEKRINHFGNYWILTKEKNRNKTDIDPAIYFKDVPDRELKRALIDKKLLLYNKYDRFLTARSEKILSTLKHKIGFEPKDFIDV